MTDRYRIPKQTARELLPPSGSIQATPEQRRERPDDRASRDKPDSQQKQQQQQQQQYDSRQAHYDNYMRSRPDNRRQM